MLNIAHIAYCISYGKIAALVVMFSFGMSLDKIKVVKIVCPWISRQSLDIIPCFEITFIVT